MSELLRNWDFALLSAERCKVQRETGASQWRNVSLESHHHESRRQARDQEGKLCVGQRWLQMGWRRLFFIITIIASITISITSLWVIQCRRKWRNYEENLRPFTSWLNREYQIMDLWWEPIMKCDKRENNYNQNCWMTSPEFVQFFEIMFWNFVSRKIFYLLFKVCNNSFLKRTLRVWYSVLRMLTEWMRGLSWLINTANGDSPAEVLQRYFSIISWNNPTVSDNRLYILNDHDHDGVENQVSETR